MPKSTEKLIKDYTETEIIAVNIILNRLKDRIISLVNEFEIGDIVTSQVTFDDVLKIKINIEELLTNRLEAATVPNMFLDAAEENDVANSKANEYVND